MLTHIPACDTFIPHPMDRTPHDIDILQRVRDSDPDAFGELFRRYQPLVFRQVFFRVRDADISHDIVQETFVRIWDHRQSLKPDLPFLALTLRIAQNIVRDMARHNAMRERLTREMPVPSPSAGDNPTDALALSMLEEQIVQILNTRLGERCRTVFVLSRYEGKTHQQIADALGISTKTVENQIARALKILRKALRT